MDEKQMESLLADNAAAEADDQQALETQDAGSDVQGADAGDASEGAQDHAQAPDAQGDAAQAKANPQTVPLAVHIREREKFRAEREQWERQQAIVNQRLQALFASQQQAVTKEAIPDRETDPIGYGLYLQEQTAARLAAVEQQRQAEAQQRAQLEQQQRVVAHVAEKVNRDEQEFISRTPDYKEAVNFLADLKRREYSAIGMTDEQVSAKLQQDAWALAIHATENGISSADYAYQLAQALGYQKKAQGTNVLEMRSKGAKTAASGGTGGSSGTPTFADLAAMDNAEFEKLTSGANWERMFR